MSNYYAVRAGRVPGIYYSWDDCLKQVHEFSGAIFKKFKQMSDAENFISTCTKSTEYPKYSSLFDAGLKTTSNNFHSNQFEVSSKGNSHVPDKKLPNISPGFEKPFPDNKITKRKRHTDFKEYLNTDLSMSVSEDSIVMYVDGGCEGLSQ